jgi:hypothetical protein
MAAFQSVTDLFIIREQPQPNYIARVQICFLRLPTSININGRARRPLSLISHCDTEWMEKLVMRVITQNSRLMAHNPARDRARTENRARAASRCDKQTQREKATLRKSEKSHRELSPAENFSSQRRSLSIN